MQRGLIFGNSFLRTKKTYPLRLRSRGNRIKSLYARSCLYIMLPKSKAIINPAGCCKVRVKCGIINSESKLVARWRLIKLVQCGLTNVIFFGTVGQNLRVLQPDSQELMFRFQYAVIKFMMEDFNNKFKGKCKEKSFIDLQLFVRKSINIKTLQPKK